MKKAVISTGSKQYLVSEGDSITIELLPQTGKTLEFSPLLVIDDANTKVGTPEVSGVRVKAEIVEQEVKADKVMAIRYKAKKRVRKVRGHRQLHTQIRIKSIT